MKVAVKTNHNKSVQKTQNVLFFTDSPVCPVYCFENYLSKLSSKRNDLWQKLKPNLTGFESEWYFNAPLGRDPLNDTMKTLSIKAKLSKEYTNHSIRATTVTTLGENDVKDRIIMATTNHRSESSLKSYHRRISAKQRREVSDILAKEMGHEVPQPPPKVAKPSSTVSIPTDKPAVTNTINNPEVTPAQPNPNEQAVLLEIPVPQNLQSEGNMQIQIVPDNSDHEETTRNEPNLNEMELEEANPDHIDDASLVEMLNKIEKENAHLFPAQQPILNVANVSNVNTNNNNRNQVPLMYFPNSKVVINYNFNK